MGGIIFWKEMDKEDSKDFEEFSSDSDEIELATRRTVVDDEEDDQAGNDSAADKTVPTNAAAPVPTESQTDTKPTETEENAKTKSLWTADGDNSEAQVHDKFTPGQTKSENVRGSRRTRGKKGRSRGGRGNSRGVKSNVDGSSRNERENESKKPKTSAPVKAENEVAASDNGKNAQNGESVKEERPKQSKRKPKKKNQAQQPAEEGEQQLNKPHNEKSRNSKRKKRGGSNSTNTEKSERGHDSRGSGRSRGSRGARGSRGSRGGNNTSTSSPRGNHRGSSRGQTRGSKVTRYSDMQPVAATGGSSNSPFVSPPPPVMNAGVVPEQLMNQMYGNYFDPYAAGGFAAGYYGMEYTTPPSYDTPSNGFYHRGVFYPFPSEATAEVSQFPK